MIKLLWLTVTMHQPGPNNCLCKCS